MITSGSALPNVPSNVSAYSARLPSDWQELCDNATSIGHPMAAMPMANGKPWMVALRSTGFNSYHCVIKSLLTKPSFELIRSARARRIRWHTSSGARGWGGVSRFDNGSNEDDRVQRSGGRRGLP